MGWALTGVRFTFQGQGTRVQASGNNAAWICPTCGHPLLLIYQQGRSGSHAAVPTECPQCQGSYHLSPVYGTLPEPSAGQSQMPAPRMEFIQL